MDFINTYPNSISKEKCEEIISLYNSENVQDSKRNDSNLHSNVREYCVTHNEDNKWEEIQNSLIPTVNKNIVDFLSFSSEINPKCYYFNHMSIMHHSEYRNLPMHYDCELDYHNDQIEMRNFAVLIYLNNNFDGGELIFPVQKKTIKPEPGLMAIFPTSFMYPHVTSPTFGADRYVLRFCYYFRKNSVIDAIKNSKSY